VTDGGHNGGIATASGAPGWVRVAILGVIGLVALWFCIRSIVLGLEEREYPLIGQSMSPPSAVSQATIALNRASAQNGIADPLARDLLQRALRRGPMLADPIIVAGLDASARNDLGRATRLMEEARRRDPRAIIPRYWLFDNYLRGGDYAKGIAEAGPLLRIQPAAEPAAVAVLTALLKVPAAHAPLVSALRARAPWRRAFFQQAAASPSLHDDAAALLRDAGSGDTVQSGREQGSVVAGMIAAGRYADAYALWLRTLPVNKRPAAPGLFDGGFDRDPGTPPFGWRLSSAGGMVGPVDAPDAPSGAGLAIRVGGDNSATLAEQLVLARPGPLRLTLATRALDQDPGSAGLKVQLRCGIKGKVLASQTIEAFSSRLETHTLSATLRPDCGAVLIRVSVAPGIEAGPLNVLLTSMALSGD